MGFFNPKVVGSGASSIAQAVNYINQAKDNIYNCNNYLDYRIKYRIYSNIGNLGNQVSDISGSVFQVKGQVDNVISDYYNTISKTTTVAGSVGSLLNPDGLNNFKQTLASDAEGFINNVGYGFSTVMDLGNMAMQENLANISETKAAVFDVASEIKNGVDNIIDGAITGLNDFGSDAKLLWDSICTTAAKAWEDTSAEVVENATNLWNDTQEAWNNFANSDFGQGVISFFNEVEKFKMCAGATIVEGILMIVNGLANIVEGVVDLVALVIGVRATIPAALIDVASYLLTGEGAGAIDNVWSNIMGFVSTEYVNNAFNYVFTETEFGKYIDNLSVLKYGSDVYNVGVIVSEIIGTVVLTILTGGAYGAAAGAGSASRVVATTGTKTLVKAGVTKGVGESGFKTMIMANAKQATTNGAKITFLKSTGQGAEDAWNDNSLVISTENNGSLKLNLEQSDLSVLDKLGAGEYITKEVESIDADGNEITTTIKVIKNNDGSYSSIVDGKTYDAALNKTTTVEGLMYGLVNGAWEGGQWLLGGKISGLGLKAVATDMLTGAADVPFRSVIQGIYSDDSFIDRFNSNGGIVGVLTNTILAGGLSGVGEVPIIKTFFGNNNKSSSLFNKKVETISPNTVTTVTPNFDKDSIANKVLRINEILSDKNAVSSYINSKKNWAQLLTDNNYKKGNELSVLFDDVFEKSGISTMFKAVDSQESSLDKIFAKVKETGDYIYITRTDGARDLAKNFSPEQLKSLHDIYKVYKGLFNGTDLELLKYIKNLEKNMPVSTIIQNQGSTIDITDIIALQRHVKKINESVLKNNKGASNYAVNAIELYLKTGVVDKCLKHSPIMNYSDEQLRDFLELTMGDNLQASLNFFVDKMDSEGHKFGVDQGIFKYLERKDPIEYNRLHQKLVNMGFTKRNAKQVMGTIDTGGAGACTYASVANEIINFFRNTPEKFEEIFGYPLLKKDGTINDAELLLDMYVDINEVANGGKIFNVKHGGKVFDNITGNHLEFDSKRQRYLSEAEGPNANIINQFLKRKNSPFEYAATNIVAHYEPGRIAVDANSQLNLPIKVDTAAVFSKVKAELDGGKNVSIGFYTPINAEHITMKSLNSSGNTSTNIWKEGGGHEAFVVDADKSGLFISSWGGIYKIEWKDLENSNFEISSSEFKNKAISIASNPTLVNNKFSFNSTIQKSSKSTDFIDLDIFKKFQLDPDDETDRILIDSIIKPIREGTISDKNVEKLLKNINILHEKSPTFQIGYWERGSSFWGPKNTLGINENDINNSMICLHELGHTFYHLILGNPKNGYRFAPTEQMETLMKNAQRKILSNQDKLEELFKPLVENEIKLRDEAWEWFNSIRTNENERIDQLVDKLFASGDSESLVKLVGNEQNMISNVKDILNNAGIELNDTEKIISDKNLVKEIARVQNAVSKQVEYYDKIMSDYSQGGDFRKMSSMINSIMQQESIPLDNGNFINCPYAHSDSYWQRYKDIQYSSYSSSLDELMADYFSISASGRTDLINQLRSVAGDELFDALSEQFALCAKKMGI